MSETSDFDWQPTSPTSDLALRGKLPPLHPEQELVDHPAHYGGANNPYEVIKVLEAWGLDKSFCLGNTIKYIARAGKKGDLLTDLRKARWYLDREIAKLEEAQSK
jgi:hypothetical protein